ncbi:2,3-bisphosphoglycerate-independent phosphoglycerate mutase [Acholeplasma equirhinis]|uniref:2,3-bisphosphoglycerate-independent phosphoglycerate mutase n=1 Tax=Acholeplasma equirhinis TaxID=555393 RepID=UPI00197ACEE7|nr:2,3-bisphosphoglycerate-independent phosphoglycerate mutase [Acholeplasma equirhinis]MBN3490622.1 2,3-bisphosphoglycerate-independent phosphoglycerate mutase [Acholeplasma equirhinis]
MAEKFAALIIMDGLGLAPASKGNSVELADKAYLDNLLKEYPNNTLVASGEAVGLPEGQMGNSEVGHLNLGAGRIVWQSLSRINVAIKDGSFFTNEAFLQAVAYAKKNNSKLHIMGLVSDGGVHSHLEHFKAMYEFAKQQGVLDRTYLHAFMDGRDTPQEGGYEYLKSLVDYGYNVATVSGRFYAMDRDNNWDRIQLAFDAMTLGNAPVIDDALEGIKMSYAAGVQDEFIKPFVVNKAGLIEDNDAVIFMNFRPDRAIRMATALSNPAATKELYTEGKPLLDVSKAPKNIFLVSMMHYKETVKGPLAYELQTFENLYGEVIEKAGLNQIRAAETEKYAHVTFFFDGGKEVPLAHSTRILVESPKVATYDLKPEMSAYELTEKVIAELRTGKYQTMILNFANPDMVGHTGSIEATKKAVEVTVECMGKVVDVITKELNGVTIVLADHGNAEQMLDAEGKPHTAHTTNLVPVVVTKKGINVNHGALCDVAPTLLDLLGIPQPAAMTGKSLISKE